MIRTGIKRILFICMCVFLAFVWLPDGYAAKSYRITDVSIDAQLQTDGSMDVIESRTFAFSGSFSFVFRTLSDQGRVTFQDFKVSENGRFYELSDSGQPGTYRVTISLGQIEVRWFFDAKNESRTFDFHYRVLNAVVRYEDAAVLYYQFISGDWDRDRNDYSHRRGGLFCRDLGARIGSRLHCCFYSQFFDPTPDQRGGDACQTLEGAQEIFA